jgi:hypothetical protein
MFAARPESNDQDDQAGHREKERGRRWRRRAKLNASQHG